MVKPAPYGTTAEVPAPTALDAEAEVRSAAYEKYGAGGSVSFESARRIRGFAKT
jgi:hypothetical protein